MANLSFGTLVPFKIPQSLLSEPGAEPDALNFALIPHSTFRANRINVHTKPVKTALGYHTPAKHSQPAAIFTKVHIEIQHRIFKEIEREDWKAKFGLALTCKSLLTAAGYLPNNIVLIPSRWNGRLGRWLSHPEAIFMVRPQRIGSPYPSGLNKSIKSNELNGGWDFCCKCWLFRAKISKEAREQLSRDTNRGLVDRTFLRAWYAPCFRDMQGECVDCIRELMLLDGSILIHGVNEKGEPIFLTPYFGTPVKKRWEWVEVEETSSPSLLGKRKRSSVVPDASWF